MFHKITLEEFVSAAEKKKPSENTITIIKEYLVQNKGNYEAINSWNLLGSTALTLAVDKENVVVVHTLINSSDVDVNAPNKLGLTPLMISTRSKNLAIFDMLLSSSNIAVNAQNSRGETALCYAADEASTEAVEKLLAAGADISLMTLENKTAADYAQKKNAYELVKIISQSRLERIDNQETDFVCKREAIAKGQINLMREEQQNIMKLQKKMKEIKPEQPASELTVDEKKLLDRMNARKKNMQMLTSLSFNAAIADLDFIISHSDQEVELNELPELIVRLSNLLTSLSDKKSDEYSRKLLKVAAEEGHAVAKHIVSQFSEKPEEKVFSTGLTMFNPEKVLVQAQIENNKTTQNAGLKS